MAATPSKIRHGVRRAFYAVRSDDGTYSAPKALEGIQQVDVSSSGGDTSTIYAGDKAFFSMSTSGTKELSVQMTRFPRDFFTDVCGLTVDETTGMLCEGPDAKQKPFAFMYETTGDQGSFRTCYFNCTATIPEFNAATDTDSINEDPETSTFTASSAEIGDKDLLRCHAEPGDAGYEAFFTKVPFTA